LLSSKAGYRHIYLSELEDKNETISLPGVFENRVLRRIFGPKRDKVTGGWRKLHNEELHGLYSSPSIVRAIKAKRMRWAGHVARMGEVRGAYNIEMDLWEIGFWDVDWIHWAQDRDRWRALVNTVMNLQVP
jgi:CRISPR/Cas system-associated protein Cas7 (RAMP superfamily)